MGTGLKRVTYFIMAVTTQISNKNINTEIVVDYFFETI